MADTLLISHGTLLPMDVPYQIIPDGAVLIEGGRVSDLGPSRDVLARLGARRREAPGAPVDGAEIQVIDAGGKLILPGNICAHTHFYGAFARGMYIPGQPAANFIEVLKTLWWRLDRALDLEGCRYSALVSLVDAIKHGTTTLIDHHASPDAIDGSLDALAGAVDEAGLRAALCYEVTDRNGAQGARAGIAENLRFAQDVRDGRWPDGRLRAAFGVHASFTVGNRSLDACIAGAREAGLPLHIHVAEDAADEADAVLKHGLRVVERLAQRDGLDERAMLAHCIHIDAREMGLIARRGAKVMHQPRSNMNNGVGVARVQRMLERGICVGLGNDGFSNDAFAEMKVCDQLHKVHARDPRAMGADKVVGMAYANNARIAGLFWDAPVGALRAGAVGDVILMDYQPFTELHAGNLPWHMLFGMSGADVTHTICNGQVLMADRKLLTLDEAEIAARGREVSARAWTKFTALSGRGPRRR